MKTTASPTQQEVLAALTQQASQPIDYQRIRLPLFDGGLRTDIEPTDLQDNQVPDILNLLLVAGRLQVDTGYFPFGTLAGGQTFFGTVQDTFQIYFANGTAQMLLFTTKTVYSYIPTLNQWQLTSTLAPGTVENTAALVAGATSFTASDVGALTNGGYIGLPLDDAEQLVATITGIIGSVVTFTPAVPAGRSVPINSSIAVGLQLNGTLTAQPCIVTFAANDWTFFTNTVDPVYYYDGEKLNSLPGTSDLPANTTCQWMIVFHESLLLVNTTENGTQRPQRVRGSDVANPLSWTPAANGGPSTSLAQIYDLIDTEDFILHAELGGPYVILYRDTTIMRGTFYGLQDPYIFWEYMVIGEGVISSGGISAISSAHAIVGITSIYQYAFGYDLEDIGQGVYVDLLSAVGDLIAEYRNTLFATYIGDYDELWIIYPSNAVNPTATVPNKLLRKNLTREAWYTREFANELVSASPYLSQSTTTWATAVGTWAQQTAVWNSRVFQANVPIYLLCAPDTNEVYAYDYSHPDDNGTAIEWSVTSKDVSPLGSKLWRWDQIRVFAVGQGVLIEYSLDAGNTWAELGTLNFGDALPTMQYLTMNAVSAYMRVRLSGSDPDFRLVWIEVWCLEESDY